MFVIFIVAFVSGGFNNLVHRNFPLRGGDIREHFYGLCSSKQFQNLPVLRTRCTHAVLVKADHLRFPWPASTTDPHLPFQSNVLDCNAVLTPGHPPWSGWFQVLMSSTSLPASKHTSWNCCIFVFFWRPVESQTRQETEEEEISKQEILKMSNPRIWTDWLCIAQCANWLYQVWKCPTWGQASPLARCLKRQSVPGVAWILGIESWEIVTFFLFTLKQTKSYFTDLLNTQTIWLR